MKSWIKKHKVGLTVLGAFVGAAIFFVFFNRAQYKSDAATDNNNNTCHPPPNYEYGYGDNPDDYSMEELMDAVKHYKWDSIEDAKQCIRECGQLWD